MLAAVDSQNVSIMSYAFIGTILHKSVKITSRLHAIDTVTKIPCSILVWLKEAPPAGNEFRLSKQPQESKENEHDKYKHFSIPATSTRKSDVSPEYMTKN